jgi:hypothetical protein
MLAILLAFVALLALAVPARADPPVPQIQALMDAPATKFDLLLTRFNMHLLERSIATPYRFYGFYSTNPGGEDHIVVDVRADADQPATKENCTAAINAAKAALDVDPATGESTVTGTTVSTIFGSLGAPDVGDAASFPDLIDSIAHIQATIVDGEEWIGCTAALFSNGIDFPPPD